MPQNNTNSPPNPSPTLENSQTVSQTPLFLPNVVLDDTNYPTWLFRMQSFLDGLDMLGYVDGSLPCPEQFVQSSDGNVTVTLESPAYSLWKRQDKNLINLIGQTLSPKAMKHVVGSKSSAQMWENLKMKFAAPNRQNILQLKSNLQNLRKGSDDVETYLDKIKTARDALETVGVQVDDEDIVVTVLRGLPAEFAAIKTVIRAQFVTCSMRELKTLLQAAEADIEAETQSSIPLTAMVASTHEASPSSSSNASAIQTQSVSSHVLAPPVPPGFSTLPSTSQGSYNVLPTQPPTILRHALAQQPFVHIQAIPYGLNSVQHFPINENMPQFTSFYANRGGMGNARPNFGGRNFGNTNSGGNFNNNGNAFNNVGNNSSITCQICNRVGHGARTCRNLLNLQGNVQSYMSANNGNNNGGCIYCGKRNHTVEKCYYLFGFPDQQQSNSSNSQGTAMLAATANAPQFWLADTGASNHMTNDAQNLNSLTPYTASDTVQIGQGDGQGVVPRTK